MADGTTQGGTAIVSGDEVTTENGTTVTARQAQRVKVDSVGADGAFRDASATYPFPVKQTSESDATFRGRATTYRAVGRAGTTPRRLLTLFNAAASGKVVHINKIDVDLLQTAAMAVTVVPPVVRIYRITAAATGGTALTKTAKDTALTSSASITITGDASADGTNSVTALAATTTAGAALSQEFAARLVTAAGYEPFDKEEFLDGWDVVCRAGEGICVSLDLTLATQDPATSNWIVGVDWYETN